jgi:hypothetical protein
MSCETPIVAHACLGERPSSPASAPKSHYAPNAGFWEGFCLLVMRSAPDFCWCQMGGLNSRTTVYKPGFSTSFQWVISSANSLTAYETWRILSDSCGHESIWSKTKK